MTIYHFRGRQFYSFADLANAFHNVFGCWPKSSYFEQVDGNITHLYYR